MWKKWIDDRRKGSQANWTYHHVMTSECKDGSDTGASLCRHVFMLAYSFGRPGYIYSEWSIVRTRLSVRR